MSMGMEESTVQWVFLKDPSLLSKILRLPLGRCLGTEVTTRYGRVDIMFNVGENRLLVVELETEIDTSG
jgi:RecB family endonuclease NucS